MSDSCAKVLADKNLTIVFIESATAGYLAHRFSVSPYSGDVLMGGLVCYDAVIKKNVLNISSRLIDEYTPESLEVTQELVKQSQAKFEADLHVACTGLLKPGGSETKEKPVGTFFIVMAIRVRCTVFAAYVMGHLSKNYVASIV